MLNSVLRYTCYCGTQPEIDIDIEIEEASSYEESEVGFDVSSSSLVQTSNSHNELVEEKPALRLKARTQRSQPQALAKAGWHSLLPEDRLYLMRNFIADARHGPHKQAIKLRKMASVSRQNYFDVLSILNSKGFEAVSLCSTRFAVPHFFQSAEGEKNSKHKVRINIAEMVAVHGHSYIDLSHNWKIRTEHKSLRAAAALGVLSADSKKWLRVDVSNYRFKPNRYSCSYPARSESEWNQFIKDQEAVPLIKALNKELMRIAGKDAMPVFDLICCDQPLFAVVYPLVKQLAALSATLPGLRSLNLNCHALHYTITNARQGEIETEIEFTKFVSHLETILTTSPSLIFMGLKANGIGPRRVVSIARALQNNTVLETLDLSRNPLTTMPSSDRMIIGGMCALKKALARNTKLLQLNLSFCGIGDAGADELLLALKKNKTLEFLDLTGNAIRHDHEIFRDKRIINRT